MIKEVLQRSPVSTKHVVRITMKIVTCQYPPIVLLLLDLGQNLDHEGLKNLCQRKAIRNFRSANLMALSGVKLRSMLSANDKMVESEWSKTFSTIPRP